jgi:aminoglycoside phosphotransferase (APT) family kinase protein
VSEEWTEELGECLGELLDAPVEIEHTALLLGGASKEAWTVDVETPEGELGLIVRRATGGALYSEALSLEQEYRVMRAARECGVRPPSPTVTSRSSRGAKPW